ncbi:VOC family protein [Glutamicibacter sp. NPDC087344]|uniref:VOC family protein n=1 Tax=Glutamicibacter sp. NPDC087344 TaxID=3363994 RepID=UPI0037F98DEF
MFLENIVFDAAEPRESGVFWQELLGCEQLTDSDQGFETRYSVAGGPVLDLCFPHVQTPSPSAQRLTLILDTPREAGAGATREVPGLLREHDPAGNVFLTPPLGERREGCPRVRISQMRMESKDPQGDARFWAEFSGWRNDGNQGAARLSHPSGRGPSLQFVTEASSKGEYDKNPMHLDLRLEPGDDPDAVARSICAAGGRELCPDWGDLPWRVFQDPSGNEFCVLPVPVAKLDLDSGD